MIFHLCYVLCNLKKNFPSLRCPWYNVNLKNIVFGINVADFSEHFKIFFTNFLIDIRAKTPIRIL